MRARVCLLCDYVCYMFCFFLSRCIFGCTFLLNHTVLQDAKQKTIIPASLRGMCRNLQIEYYQ